MSITRIFATAVLCAGLAVVPDAAHAGTTTATYTATMEALSNCSVAGATVSLGNFTPSQTWANVAAELGLYDGSLIAGSRGQEYIAWGSVTCDAGIPYTLNIKGTGTHIWVPGGIVFTKGGVNLYFNPFVKRIGDTVMPDTGGSSGGFGAYVGAAGSPASAVGTGAAQQVLGSVTFNAVASPYLTTPLGAPGLVTDTLTYILNF